MSEKTDAKRCYVCKAELDPKRDKGKFVEAEGKTVCRHHPGVEKWYEEVAGKVSAPVPESRPGPA